jgi:glucose-6-phosphate 1-dehydrogenase
MNSFNTNRPEGCLLFLFGATGDLARRKLYPAIYSMYKEQKIGENFAVIGLARRSRTDEQYREDIYASVREFARYDVTKDEQWEKFASHFHYHSMNINELSAFYELLKKCEQLEEQFYLNGNRLFYLALAPELFGQVAIHLKESGLLSTRGWRRLVIEKPFGYDLKSAEKLNSELRQVFEEHEIFRIDHYLGKEMVQNIEVIRFANAFFEPLWNRKYISNIQITLSETVGVEDRGEYYDQAGAIRDMAQNHMLQMVAMMAMEPPSRPIAEDIRDEKVKVLRSLRMFTPQEVRENVIRGQYTAGQINGQPCKGYRDEDKVDPNSMTETFFAAKLYVDNFRWAGVPFYVRTGKRLPVKSTEIVVEFKNMPDHVHFTQKGGLEPNLLVFRVQPMEGIYIRFNAKKPGGEAAAIVPVAMDFCQSCQVGLNTPEAYERLLTDAIAGDSTYFTRWDEVSLAWEFVDRIVDAWKTMDDLHFYPAGSWGPEATKQLLEREGHHWWPVHGQHEGEIVWEMAR